MANKSKYAHACGVRIGDIEWEISHEGEFWTLQKNHLEMNEIFGVKSRSPIGTKLMCYQFYHILRIIKFEFTHISSKTSEVNLVIDLIVEHNVKYIIPQYLRVANINEPNFWSIDFKEHLDFLCGLFETVSIDVQ